MKNTLAVIGVFLCVLYLSCAQTPARMMFKVEPKTEDCFYENYPANAKVDLEWAVLDGGLLDIEVRVFQGETRIYTKLYFEGREDGKYSFVTSADGPVGFCFNNEMSRFTVKTCTFSLENMKGPEQVKKSDLTSFEQAIQRVERGFDVIEQEQRYYRVREHAHRNTAESTNTRVYVWSLVESVILLLMSICQIWYLRRMFDDNKRRSGI